MESMLKMDDGIIRWIDEEAEEAEIGCPSCRKEITVLYGIPDVCPFCDATVLVRADRLYVRWQWPS